MKKLFTIIAIILIAIIGFAALSPQEEPSTTKLKVVTSAYPLSEFASIVGDNLVEVTSITPNGIEPHDYEPSPQDIKKILESDVFIINGNGLDSWAEKILTDTMNKNVSFLRVSDHMQSIMHEEDEHEDDDEHDHGQADPHFWMDPINVEKISDVIAQTFVIADPMNKEIYENQAELYSHILNNLHQRYESELTNCAQTEIVVSHDAFAYLGERYSISFIAISGLSPESEPSASQLAQLTRIVNDRDIKYIFTETLVSPRVAQTLSLETDAQLLTLNPLEGLTKMEQARGATYISVMEQNLENLKVGLECN